MGPTAKMSDDESCFSAEERNKKGKGGVAKSMFKTKRERVRTKESDELDETLNQYIEEWRSRRRKERRKQGSWRQKQGKRNWKKRRRLDSKKQKEHRPKRRKSRRSRLRGGSYVQRKRRN